MKTASTLILPCALFVKIRTTCCVKKEPFTVTELQGDNIMAKCPRWIIFMYLRHK